MISVYVACEQHTFDEPKKAYRFMWECAKNRVPELHVFFHKKNSGQHFVLKGNRYVEKQFHPLLPFGE